MSRRVLGHVAFAVVVVIAVAAVRLLIAVDSGLVEISNFEAATGRDVGPNHGFFGAGLGGDGATNAIIALDPFGANLGGSLFLPSFRYSRLGYPWIAATVVAGIDSLVLLGLSAVGLIAVGVMAFLASRLNVVLGWRSWFLVINPALIVGGIRDTAEPIALVALTLALLVGTSRYGAAIALIRPSYLVALGGRLRMLGPSLVIALVSKAAWSARFGESMLTGGETLDWPLFGVVQAPSTLAWIVTLAAGVTATIGIVRRDWSWAIGGMFVLMFSWLVLDTPTNAVRAAGYLPVLWAFGPNWDPASHRQLTAGTVKKEPYPET